MFNKYRLTALGIALVIGGLLVWWQIGASSARDEIAEIQDILKAEGWRAEPGEISISGMPMRINYNFENPALQSPDGAWGWSAAEAHVRRLLYRRNVYQLGAPGAHRLRTPFGAFEAQLQTAAASLRFGTGGGGSDFLSRLSVVLSGLQAEGAEAMRIEAHFGLTKPASPKWRKLFVKADALQIGAAASLDLTMTGRIQFDAPFSRATSGIPQPVRLEIRSTDEAAPGLLLRFRLADGKEATLEMKARLSRDPGRDAVLGWMGEGSFVTDQGAEVIDHLGAMGLLDASSQASLKARLADSGRLAGVFKLDGARVEIHDVAPQPIRVKAP